VIVPTQKMPTGLTLNQVVETAAADIPSESVGDVLRRLPQKYRDPDLQLYRPVTPAILLALDAVDECCAACDTHLAEIVEVVSCDPAPAHPAWTFTPDGQKLQISAVLQLVAGRLAALYAPPKPRSPRTPVPAA
jgi:hypothetical protein